MSGRAQYKASLRELQIELVKVQSHVIKHGHKVLVIFEGRDVSGKDGTIKHVAVPDFGVAFPYDEAHAKAGLLAA